MINPPIRLRTHSNPVADDCCEAYCDHDVFGLFVVAVGNPSEVFQAAKHARNAITSAMALAVEGIWLLAIGLIGDDRPELCPYEPSPPMVCVISASGYLAGGR